jgi:ribosome biogenesis GTPase A
MLKTRVLKIFDCLKILIIKIHVQSKISNLQRVLKKINHMHRDLTKIIFSLSTLKSDSANQKKEQTKMIMKIFAKNLNVMIKHCNKNVIKRLKNRIIIQIVAKMNTIIDYMKNELRETTNVTNDSSMNQVLIFQHLCNENIKFFVRKKRT